MKKKACKIFLTLMLAFSIGAFFQSCGHGRDAEPYATGSTGSANWENLLEEQEPIPLGIVARNVVDDTALDSMRVFADILSSIDFTVPYINLSKVSNAYNYVPSKYDEFSLIREGEYGGIATIVGNTITASQFGIHCAIIADYSVEYASYSNVKDAFISGTEDVRIVAISYGCNFYRNMHVDFKISGDLEVNGGTIRDLAFSADNTYTDGATILVDSAMFYTDEDMRYCSYYEASDRTVCTSIDSVVTEEGSDLECDPSVDSRYSAIYILNGTEYPYEVTLRCSDEGLWTPPCPLDGSYDACPQGMTCVAPYDDGWGYNLEDYGYCSSSDLTQR